MASLAYQSWIPHSMARPCWVGPLDGYFQATGRQGSIVAWHRCWFLKIRGLGASRVLRQALLPILCGVGGLLWALHLDRLWDSCDPPGPASSRDIQDRFGGTATRSEAGPKLG